MIPNQTGITRREAMAAELDQELEDDSESGDSSLSIGKLESVDPRLLWPDEAGDFTPWLRDNIERIGAVLGINFDSVNSEEPVGRYNADLWGQEEGTRGRGVLIENQLTESNHDHLGKLLTYGAGLKADISVWVATQFRLEHLEALRWLNDSGNDRRHYFAIQLEVFKISKSEPAPIFRVLVQPPGWTSTSRPTRSTPSPRMKAYHQCFDQCLKDLKQRDATITQMNRVGYQSWIAMSAGRLGFQYAISFARNQRFRVELYIDCGDRDKNKTAFDTLESRQVEIEQEIGIELGWERLEDARASRIAMYTAASIDYAAESLQELSAWAIDGLVKFRCVFGERIKQL